MNTSNECVVIYPELGAIPRAYGPFKLNRNGKATEAVKWIKKNRLDVKDCLILFLENPVSITKHLEYEQIKSAKISYGGY